MSRTVCVFLARWSAATALALICVAPVSAQRNRGYYMPYDPVTDKVDYDGHFTFIRLKYTVGPGGYYYMNEPAWAHGYQKSETNLLRIAADISLLRPRTFEPDILAIDDPELFKYPISYMTEAGYWVITDSEVKTLRRYLARGGFLILDDTRDNRGNWASINIAANFQRVFPGYHIVNLTPSHPIFHSFFDIPSFDVVKQYYDQGPPVFQAIFKDDDPKKRIMVLINFNTDISNFWEFSAQGLRPVDESNQAYKLGFNYLMYGLSH
jgi:uncharacterized protein DUF4159